MGTTPPAGPRVLRRGQGLWTSFAGDPFRTDPESGLFFDPERMTVLEHRGAFPRVKNPRNVARPVHAGASEAGRQIAAG